MAMHPSLSKPLANNHISVDCVVLGWDGELLKVLLIGRDNEGSEYNDMKLPGSLIYQDEDLDEAASRVLGELTGMHGVGLVQYKAYGSKDRTRNPRDIIWLERAQKAHVERIVTIAYITMLRLTPSSSAKLSGYNAKWTPIENVGTLAFDHNLILREALVQMRTMVSNDPSLLFKLLPRKFTLAQLRHLFEVVYDKQIDVRNFHKKVASLPYVVPLDEYQQGVAHRAARYFKFDRKSYNHLRR